MANTKEDTFNQNINKQYLRDKQQARKQSEVPNQYALIKQHLAQNTHQYSFLQGNVNLQEHVI